jgi:hypothetical protein
MALKSHFTTEHCWHIMWAILDNGRAYFEDVKTTLDFNGASAIVFPQLYLMYILRNIRYTMPVEQANLPDEWVPKAKPPQGDQGGRSRPQG